MVTVNPSADTTAQRSHPSLGCKLELDSGDALLVIDVQRDFLPGGSLAVPAGDQIIAPLNAYISAFAARELPIFLSRDWHPPNHCSFRSERGKWPAHCIQGSVGAQWAPGLNVLAQAHVISKATERCGDAYSAFAGTALLPLLRDLAVKRLFVGGLATDYCVHATVIDARTHGYEVVLLADAIRGVNAEPGDVTGAIKDMLQQGASLFQRSRELEMSAIPAPHRRPATEHVIAGYGFGTTLAMPFITALERVVAALQAEGFGLLMDIDVQATLQKKLGAEIAPYRILGACNPPLAYKVLQAEPSAGLLLPCNVVVRQSSPTTVEVEFLEPNVLATLTQNPALGIPASLVRDKLSRVMSSLPHGTG
jgi:nicotinamidase/pyrazinamidase